MLSLVPSSNILFEPIRAYEPSQVTDIACVCGCTAATQSLNPDAVLVMMLFDVMLASIRLDIRVRLHTSMKVAGLVNCWSILCLL